MDFKNLTMQLQSIRNAISQAKNNMQSATASLTNTYNNLSNDCYSLSTALGRPNVASNWREVVNLVNKIKDGQRRCADYKRQIDRYRADLEKQEIALNKLLSQIPTKM